MLKSLRVVFAAASICAMPVASASVLTFDDLSGVALFTADYQGFRFGTNSAATNAFFHSIAATPDYQPVSGSFVAVDPTLYDSNNLYQGTTAASLSGPQQLITSATPFVFDGAFFSGGDRIGFKLYNGNTPVFTTSIPTLIGAVPTFVASQYAGLVTGVEIFGPQGYYVFDNFTYTVAPAAVPEPASVALMLIGVLGAGAVARRRRIAAT